MKRGLWVANIHYTNIDFGNLESKGLTDVYTTHNNLALESGYSGVKSDIEYNLNILETTNINLHLHTVPFIPINGVYPNPANEDRNKILVNNLVNICNETDITGVSLDDFVYPSSLYDFNHYETQANNLKKLANQIKTSIHDLEPNKTFGACLGWGGPLTWDYGGFNAGDIRKIAPELDYVIPMIYSLKGAWQVPPNQYFHETLSWLKYVIRACKIYAGDTPLRTALITYDSDGVSCLMSEIVKEINIAIQEHVEGYILYNYTYGPHNEFYFPDKIIRSSVNRSNTISRINIPRISILR